MDLGLSNQSDFFTTGQLSPEEMDSLLNPNKTNIPEHISAVQILLNQGAEYLARKQPTGCETLMNKWSHILSCKSRKVKSVSMGILAHTPLQNPIGCLFDIGATEQGFIAFDWRLGYLLIDGLLGGINGISIEKDQEQPYSPIEQNILRPIFSELLTSMAEDLGLSIKTNTLSADNPLPSANRTEITFFVKTPLSSGKIYLNIPTDIWPQTTQKPLLHNISDLSKIPMDVQVIADGFHSTLSFVKSWQVGTMLNLGHPTITLTTQDAPVAHVRLSDTHTDNRQVIVEDTHDF